VLPLGLYGRTVSVTVCRHGADAPGGARERGKSKLVDGLRASYVGQLFDGDDDARQLFAELETLTAERNALALVLDSPEPAASRGPFDHKPGLHRLSRRRRYGAVVATVLGLEAVLVLGLVRLLSGP
jgi:hypothetical protein